VTEGEPLERLLGLPLDAAEALVRRWGFEPVRGDDASPLDPAHGKVVLFAAAGVVARAMLGDATGYPRLRQRLGDPAEPGQ
jgi:hypothetical protein